MISKKGPAGPFLHLNKQILDDPCSWLAGLSAGSVVNSAIPAPQRHKLYQCGQPNHIQMSKIATNELETLFAIMLQFIDQVVLRARKNLYARAGKLFLQHPEVMLPVNCTVSIALHNNR